MTRTAPLMPLEVLENPRKQRFDRYFYNFAVPLVPNASKGADRLLDIGCGTGEICRITSKLGWEPTGIDGSESNVDATEDFGFDAVRGDLNDPLPFDDQSFDCATMIEVVEHVVRAEALMKEIARVLKPGSRLVISTPNNAFYKRRLGAMWGKAPDEEGYHFRFWIRRKLEKKLADAGFRVERRNSLGYFPGMNELMMRKEKKRIRVPGPFETLFAEHFCWRLVRA